MRLLNVNTLKLAAFYDHHRPKYAIASHRWGAEEVTLREIQKTRDTDKLGYKKIESFAKYVREHVLGMEWLWIDTCCIDKTNAAELSESINSMFGWYRDAVVCIAYLADVKEAGDTSAFEQSDWFRRGWTLQELLAPQLVVFVTVTWQVIGNKGASTCANRRTPCRLGLETSIAAITRIPEQVLHNYGASAGLTFEDKLEWMERRTTTRPEDLWYALYGIVGIALGANYGEGYEGARDRLYTTMTMRRDIARGHAERFRKMVQWLSPPDPWKNHESARMLREPRSGSWLLQSTLYQNWKNSETRHLWVHGSAGCGKTVLCSTAIEDVRAYCESQQNTVYAVFFFSRSEDRKQRVADLLCSLVAQLGWKGDALLLLQQIFETPHGRLPGVYELEQLLFACFRAFDKVFLLIDALDECPEDNDVRYSIMRCLFGLSRRASNLKIFATSRKRPDIRAWTTGLGALPLPIPTHSVNEDIRQYVVRQLSEDYRLCRLDEKTKALIQETLLDKSDGMFRWVYCALQEVKKLKSTKPAFVARVLNDLLAIDDSIESQADDSSSVSDDSSRGYAESIPSFTTSVSSANTLVGDAVSDALINDFVQCLFCNNDLSPLNLAALMDPAIGAGKFRKNVNRLIRHYGNDLKEETASKDEVRVARVLRQGNVAVRAAQTIIDVTEHVQQRHQNPSRVIIAGEISSLATESKADSTESVLQRIPLQPFPEDDSDDDTSTFEDEFEDPGLAQQNFSDIKEALLESRAYARFKERLLDFVNKPYQKRISKAIGSEAISSAGVPLNDTALKALASEMSFVPAKMVKFRYVEKSSCSDRVKGLIETWMGESWDWSPLAQRKYALKDNWCRVMWKMPSGDLCHVDLPVEAADALADTMESAPGFVSIPDGLERSSDDPGPETASPPSANASPLLGRSLFETLSLSQLVHKVFMSVLTRQYNQQTQKGTVPSIGAVSGTSPSTSTPPSVPGVPPGSSSAPVASHVGVQNVQVQYKQPDHRHVFLCVRNGVTYKFSDIETHVLKSDSEFFGRLKSDYLLLRGSYKRWFSWWQYDRCDFYQFSKYPMSDADEAVPQHIGYPKTTDTEYYFDPRPIDPCPPSGPISDQEFRNRFHKSCYQCYSWHFWHKRKLTGRLHSQQAIARLPKRGTALNMQDGKREIFWGIYARERRSFARVAAYGLLANVPSIVFFFLWLFRWGHASDLQNAAVSAGMSLSFTMLFMALLYESREIELR